MTGGPQLVSEAETSHPQEDAAGSDGGESSVLDLLRRPPTPEVVALQQREPALVIAFLVAVVAYLVQVAAGVHSAAAIGTAVGISGVQGILTRKQVTSPATVAVRRLTRRPLERRAAAFDQLQELGALHERGVVGADEFASRASELLES